MSQQISVLSVESSKKNWEDIVFLQVYIGVVREKGLLRKLGPQNTQTLLALATFIDKDGKCYPSQATLGYVLGISASQANDRINGLIKFEFEGKPILKKEKHRSTSGVWSNNVYTILPESGFRIFDTGTANLTVSESVEAKEVERNTNYTQSLTIPKDLTIPNVKPVKLSKKELETSRGEDGRGFPEPLKEILIAKGIPIKGKNT